MMIVACGACAAQNFVSAERRAAAHIPPACWKCGADLPAPGETDLAAGESKQRGKEPTKTGDGRDG